jgi:methylated-DNA-[protein]-cysteine S-methyltransferase
MSDTFWDRLAAPWGSITFVTGANGKILAIDVNGKQFDGSRDAARCRPAAQQLTEYFAGQREKFTLDLAPDGTAFQRSVWAALLDIPYGQVVTYGELAKRIGQPKAARAVGAANGANPIPVLIPCHRVIAAGGELGGYTGGLQIKQSLLEIEGQRLAA